MTTEDFDKKPKVTTRRIVIFNAKSPDESSLYRHCVDSKEIRVDILGRIFGLSESKFTSKDEKFKLIIEQISIEDTCWRTKLEGYKDDNNTLIVFEIDIDDQLEDIEEAFFNSFKVQPIEDETSSILDAFPAVLIVNKNKKLKKKDRNIFREDVEMLETRLGATATIILSSPRDEKSFLKAFREAEDVENIEFPGKLTNVQRRLAPMSKHVKESRKKAVELSKAQHALNLEDTQRTRLTNLVLKVKPEQEEQLDHSSPLSSDSSREEDDEVGDPSSREPSVAFPHVRPANSLFKYDYLARVMLLGPSGAGKTALQQAVAGKGFPENYSVTNEPEFEEVVYTVSGRTEKKVNLIIWDSTNSAVNRELTIKQCQKKISAAVFVVDATGSFEDYKKYIAKIKGNSEWWQALKDMPKYLVVSKTDRADKPSMSKDNVDELERLLEVVFTDCNVSAKNKKNVNRAFQYIADCIVDEYKDDVDNAHLPSSSRRSTDVRKTVGHLSNHRYRLQRARNVLTFLGKVFVLGSLDISFTGLTTVIPVALVLLGVITPFVAGSAALTALTLGGPTFLLALAVFTALAVALFFVIKYAPNICCRDSVEHVKPFDGDLHSGNKLESVNSKDSAFGEKIRPNPTGMYVETQRGQNGQDNDAKTDSSLDSSF